MTKEKILSLFEADGEDNALEPFYELFGPSVRSEYELDGLAIVDLDWEKFGCVISFVDDELNQIRLLANHEQDYTFKGWMGDDIPTSKGGSLVTLSYMGHNYNMDFEFLDTETLDSLTISKKI